MSKNNKTVLVPKLRFSEFWDDDKWQEKKIGEIGEVCKGKGISKADIDKDGATKCIRYGELYTTYGEIIRDVYSKTNVPTAELILSRANDVIIPSSGETKIDIATASCVLLDNVALGGDLNIIRTDVNGLFLSYHLNGAKKFEIASIAQGDTVVHLYANQLIQLKIFLPEVSEQQKIADCLSSLDELIAAEDKKLEELTSHKKGLMQKLFPNEGKAVPEWRFSEFRSSGEWGKVKIVDAFDLQDGFAFSSNDFISGDSPKDSLQVIRIADINNKNKTSDKVFIDYNFLKNNNLSKYIIQRGDLLLSLTGAAGFNFFVWDSARAVLNQRTLKISPKNKKQGSLKHLLEPIVYEELNKNGTGQNNNLSKKIIEDTIIIIPKDPKEQQKIADCLSSIDQLITAQSKKVEELKVHKKGLLQGLFPSFEEVCK